MNKDFNELVDYLDKRFAKLENDVDVIKQKMATREDVNRLLNAVDAYMKQGEDFRQEFLMLGHKVDRHEKWLLQIAQKVGVKLEH